MAVLRAENIGFSYPDGTSALHEVSFTIGAGERVGIIGSNGAGKSTLARLLNGLLAPSTGKVWVDDWDTSVTPASLIATKVGYVFPYPRQQLFLPQAIAEVMFGPRNLGWSESKCQKVAQEALEVVDLWEKRDANPQELGDSGRKRLSWATVLAMKSEVVIFDEPTASLDAHSWDCLQRVMATLQQRNSTVVVISHNMDLVADNCQRLLVLHEGHLRADASLDQGWKAAEECGLELPCSRLLGRLTGRGEVNNSAEFLEALQERK